MRSKNRIVSAFLASVLIAIPAAVAPEFEGIRVPSLVIIGGVTLVFVLTFGGMLVWRWFRGMRGSGMRLEEIDLSKLNDDEDG